MTEAGAILVGIAEWSGSIYNPNGINIEDFHKHNEKFKGDKLDQFKGAQFLQGDEVMYKDCDIFVPAALEQAINRNNAKKFKCKLIVEAANGATTVKGDKYLNDSNILVVPDILANAGGVTCSYFEWLKNLDHRKPGRMTKKWEEKSKTLLVQGLQHSFEEAGLKINLNKLTHDQLRGAEDVDIVHTALDNIMNEALRSVVKTAEEKNCTLRLASYVLAINRVNRYYDQLGLVI